MHNNGFNHPKGIILKHYIQIIKKHIKNKR